MVRKKRKKVSKKKDVDVSVKVDKCNFRNWHQGKCSGFWGFGCALAMILSYIKGSSIFWAIVHGILSWFYVIYRIFVDYKVFG